MVEEGEFCDMFECFGCVIRVFLVKDWEMGLVKGFVFISFVDWGDVVKVVEKMDGFGFKYLILRVEFVKKVV